MFFRAGNDAPVPVQPAYNRAAYMIIALGADYGVRCVERDSAPRYFGGVDSVAAYARQSINDSRDLAAAM